MYEMYDENLFSARLAQLRNCKGVSARDMSLSIGQSENYINNIENKRALPSMMGFFYICEYLDVSPTEFFDEENKDPKMLEGLVADLKKLDRDSMELISALVKKLGAG